MDHSLHGQDRGLVRSIPIEGIDIRSEPLRHSALVDADRARTRSPESFRMKLAARIQLSGGGTTRLGRRRFLRQITKLRENLCRLSRFGRRHSPTAGRNCLIIPERTRSGLLRVVKTDPEAPFRYLEYPLTRTFGSPQAIYQTVSSGKFSEVRTL
jgi:hypothetical protein